MIQTFQYVCIPTYYATFGKVSALDFDFSARNAKKKTFLQFCLMSAYDPPFMNTSIGLIIQQ